MSKTKRHPTSAAKPTISPLIIGIVVIASVLVVAGLILLGTAQNSAVNAPVDISQFPAKGSAEAPVTIIEFSDYG